MKRLRLLSVGLVVLAVLTPITAVLADNFLDPPGAPDSLASRQWTMNQREARTAIYELPFTITKPGSYFLAGSLVCTNSDVDGIVIDSDDVKLDLNGFALNGISNGINGIVVAGLSRHNITIRNGVVRGWLGLGISAVNAHESIISGITAFQNMLGGLRVGGHCLIENCGAYKNEGTGIQTGEYTTLKDCKALDQQNNSSGIQIGDACQITRCIAARNKKHGIMAGSSCTIEECTALSNTSDGINVQARCRAMGNNCSGNQKGINAEGDGNRIEDNNVSDNATGIASGGGNLIIRNSASGSTQAHIVPGTNDQVGLMITEGGTAVGSGEPWANFIIPKRN